MREFFNGWKRKLGVVTLLTACAFAAGWVRSLTIGDQSTIRMNMNSLFWMISNNGWFGCVAVLEPNVGSTTEFFRHWTDKSSPSPLVMGPFDGVPYRWNWASSPHFILPYSTLVVPLTLLSAWLLLSKPRPAKRVAPPVTTAN